MPPENSAALVRASSVDNPEGRKLRSSRHLAIDRNTAAYFAIVLLALLFHVCGALWTAVSTPFPSKIDELQHFSYMREMAQAPALFPRFERFRIVDNTLDSFTPEANYLNHPSPYYHLMAWIDDAGLAASTRVRLLRVANLTISSIGLTLILWSAVSLLPSLTTFATFAAIFVMFPKLAIVGGLINNDNLGILATGLCFAGLVRVYQGAGYGAGVLLGVGIALAGWTKLPVLMVVGFALIAAELLRISGVRTSRRSPVLGIAAAIGATGVIPTLQNYLAYGWPLYIYAGHDHNFVPVADRPALNFIEHGVLFLRQMVLKWPALEPAHWLQIAGLMGVAIAILATATAQFRRRGAPANAHAGPSNWNTANQIATAYGLSLVVTMVAHIVFGWRVFQELGDLTSAQPRYYYAVWPGLALGAALAVHLLPHLRLRFYVRVALLLTLAMSTIQIAAFSGWLSGRPLVPG